MIYAILFFEFFKIGLFAVGGGLVAIPFLFDLAEHYPWFNAQELTDMIAVSESTPGPIGVNMATFAGFKAAGVWGGITATIGLVLPSIVVIIIVANLLKKFRDNPYVVSILSGIRPAVIALILMAAFELAKYSILDWLSALVFVGFLALIYFWKKSPIFYMIIGAVVGIVLKL